MEGMGDGMGDIMDLGGDEGKAAEGEKMAEEKIEDIKAEVPPKEEAPPKEEIKLEEEEEEIRPRVEKAIEIKEEDKIKPAEKKLLNVKRERKSRRIPIQLGGKKEKKIRKPTSYQEILNKVEKLPLITIENVKQAAKDMNYQLDDTSVKFFTDLGLAKVSLKKYGLPSNICKEPFHFYCTSDFYKSYLRSGINTITDDKLILDIYRVYNFSKDKSYAKYQAFCEFSTLEKFSFVSNRIAKITETLSGYVQDFSPNIAIICQAPFRKEALEEAKKSITSDKSVIKELNYGLLNGEKVNFYKYGATLLAGKSNESIDQLLAYATEIKCVSSKNKLKSYLKFVKLKNEIAGYLNIVDMKPSDFSPSVLMVYPEISNFTMFFDSKLDLNTVYRVAASRLNGDLKGIEYLNFPPNAVFWDNIGSYAQLLGLVNLITQPKLGAQIVELISIYNNYRDVIKGWRTVYKIFESIILSFYDNITTHLTIDNVTKLDAKASDFISKYNYLKRNKTFERLRKLLSLISNCSDMQNFALTNIPLEIIYALRRLINILRMGKTDGEMTEIVDMFRTIGIYCTRVLYGGQYEMIPKVRSPAAFLGGVSGDMDNETLKENIEYLLKTYKADKKEGEKEVLISYEDMDDLVDAALINSNKNVDDTFINDNFNKIKEQIKGDRILYNSLRNEITELLRDGVSQDEIRANYDFLENPILVNYLVAFKKVEHILKKSAKGKRIKAREISEVIKIDPASAEKLRKVRKFKGIGKKKIKEKKEKKGPKKRIGDLKKGDLGVININEEAVADVVGDEVAVNVNEEIKKDAQDVLAKKGE